MGISNIAKDRLERNIKLSMEEISNLSLDEEFKHVESLIGSPLTFSTSIDTRMIGRGNPLLSRKKITTMVELNKKIDALKV